MNYKVEYPSGKRLRLSGKFAVVKIKGILAPHVDDGVQVTIIDPRAIVRDEHGALIYNPRDFMFLFDNEMFQWMRENPSWAQNLTMAV